MVSINVEYFLFQLFFALLIFSSKLLSPGVNAGCPNLLNCTAGQCCSANSGGGGSCGTKGGSYYYHCVYASSSSSSSSTYEEEEEEEFEEAAAAAAGATVLAAAAAAPPPLPMMVPQGLPQPGAVSAGGGVLPATALAVS